MQIIISVIGWIYSLVQSLHITIKYTKASKKVHSSLNMADTQEQVQFQSKSCCRDLNDLIYKQQEALEQVKAAFTLAVERMKWYYDQKVQSVPFKVSDKILLNLKDYQTIERALQFWYKGPFKIIEKLSLVTFWLRMLSRYQVLHPVFHASKLVQCSKSTIYGQKSTPLPLTLIQGQKEQEVEKILDSQQRHGKNKFLIR